MRGRALPGALALMAASGAWMVAGAPPAAAYVCAFNVASPRAGSISGSSTVPFRGAFEVRHGVAERVLEVTFTSAPGPLPPPTVSRRSSIDLGGTYDVPVGPLSRNGTYTARVRAVHTGTSPLLNCDDDLGPERRDTEASAVVQFKVSVQASPPRNVAARFDPGSRSVTVTWERSGDPDIVGYTITKKVGSAPATAVGVGPDPLSWTDTNLPSGGATITYSVQASRQGPDSGTTSLPSAPVAAAPLVVPDGPAPTPPPSPTTGPPGSPADPGGGVTSTTVPFVLGPAVGGDTPPSRAVPFLPFGELKFPESTATTGPDGQGGYQPLIPYPAGGGNPPIDGGDQAIAGRSSSGGERGDETPGLAYVASGLLSSVVAAHILWLRRQALRPEPAGAGRLRELETVSPPDAEPSPPAPTPVAEGASPFEPEPDDSPVDGPEDPEAAGSRQPLRAVREPAVVAAAAGAGAGILRPARDGSGTFEPGTPLPQSERTAPTARPGPEPDVRIMPAGRPASGESEEPRPRSKRRREDAAASRRRQAPIASTSHEEVAAAGVRSARRERGDGSSRIPESDAPEETSTEPAEVAAPATPSALSVEDRRSADLPASPAAGAEFQPTSPQTSTGTLAITSTDVVREPARARPRLRSRIGRSRQRSTPWVAAESVEPAAPVGPDGDEAVDPAGQARPGDAAERTPGGRGDAGGAEPGEVELATAGRPMLILRPKGPKRS